MHTTHRVQDLPPHLSNELEWRASALAQSGVDVIPLIFGNPDGPTPPAVVAAGIDALSDPSTHGYSSNLGRPGFRHAVADYYERRFGVVIDADTMVVPAIGAKESIFNLNLALLDPGDLVIAPDPGYQTYTAGPLLVGAGVHSLPLHASEGQLPDLKSVPGDVAARASILYLNYPNSPTGAVATDEFFTDVVQFARVHELVVVHDAVYSEFTFDGLPPRSFLATAGALDVGVEIMSTSKSHNMAGWRCGAVVGNPDVVAAYRRLKTFVDSGMFAAVQVAAETALSADLDDHVAATRATYERRRDLVVPLLAEVGIDADRPAGAVYVWAKVPAHWSSSSTYCQHVLEDCGVALSPGAAYGPAGEGWFRMSLTVEERRLVEAVERIADSSASTVGAGQGAHHG